MPTLVPNRLLLRFELALRYRSPTLIDGKLGNWADDYQLPDLCALDEQEPFAKLWMGWHETGLYLAVRVEGRSSAFVCDPKQFWRGDNVRVMTDMRDTRDIKRASRYCQQFFFLPAGGGKDGRDPVAGAARIHRATEHAPPVSADLLQVACRRERGGYSLEAHIPAEVLAGFDPKEHRRIGLYVMIEDRELGQQYLTVGDDLNWFIDPSTWVTAVMEKGK